MNKTSYIYLLLVLLLLPAWPNSLQAAAIPTEPKPSPQQLLNRPDRIPGLLQQHKISVRDIPDPHWQKNGCIACHKQQAKAGRHNLRHRDMDKNCTVCHDSLSEHSYIHVSNIKLPGSMTRRMPKGFRAAVRRGGNKLTCITCHDLPMTCKKKQSKQKGLNPMFFRDGPYQSRTALCYKCHNVKKYQRVNAHDQINDKGQLRKDKCLLCHTANQDMTTANIIDDVEYNLKDNLSRLCWGCHPWKPHPGGSFRFFSGKGGLPNHLVKPSSSVLHRLQKMQMRNDVVFPLEPGTGKVYCATCHNPHERGVIKLKQAAKGADSENRLRMQQICENCHDK